MTDIDWSRLVIGMLGGDRREQEIARLAAATGATVRAHGFPWPERGIPGVVHLDDPAAVDARLIDRFAGSLESVAHG